MKGTTILSVTSVVAEFRLSPHIDPGGKMYMVNQSTTFFCSRKKSIPYSSYFEMTQGMGNLDILPF